jgi:hypothetical protein
MKEDTQQQTTKANADIAKGQHPIATDHARAGKPHRRGEWDGPQAGEREKGQF